MEKINLLVAPRKLGTSPSKVKVVVVAGPTASGKSNLAIRLAQRFNGEIISADSRQVYRGMDIGTGKVSMREQKMVRHWMIDVASPNQQYSVVKFKKAAERAITDINGRGKLPIICGGTGFWIDALVYGQSIPSVKPDHKLRTRLQRFTTSQLYSRLTKLDPARAAAIDRHNPVRLIRALEIVMSTGQPIPPATANSPYDILYLSLSVPKAKLARRIARRLDSRLKAGMVSEVRHLHAGRVSWKRLESFGLEYRWVARFLQKQLPRQEMREGLLRDIIAYSKRQMTWWRKNKDIHWVTGLMQATRLVRKATKSATRR